MWGGGYITTHRLKIGGFKMIDVAEVIYKSLLTLSISQSDSTKPYELGIY